MSAIADEAVKPDSIADKVGSHKGSAASISLQMRGGYSFVGADLSAIADEAVKPGSIADKVGSQKGSAAYISL